MQCGEAGGEASPPPGRLRARHRVRIGPVGVQVVDQEADDDRIRLVALQEPAKKHQLGSSVHALDSSLHQIHRVSAAPQLPLGQYRPDILVIHSVAERERIAKQQDANRSCGLRRRPDIGIAETIGIDGVVHGVFRMLEPPGRARYVAHAQGRVSAGELPTAQSVPPQHLWPSQPKKNLDRQQQSQGYCEGDRRVAKQRPESLPPGVTQAPGGASASASASCRSALPRWLTRSFSSGLASPKVRPSSSLKKNGS